MARNRVRNKAEKKLDAAIERIYYSRCSGVQINIMDIPKVFAAGHAAAAAGADIEAAIVARVAELRLN